MIHQNYLSRSWPGLGPVFEGAPVKPSNTSNSSTLNHAATTLQKQLKLAWPPIAVAFQDKAPEGIERVQTPGPAGCSYWKFASEGQIFYTEASDHFACPIGSHTHGIDLPEETAKELEGLVQTMVGLQYIRKEDIAGIPRRKEPFHVALYAPLAAAPFQPDVILVRGSVKQLMLLVEAVQAAGIANTTSVMGRPTCAVLPEAIQTGAATTSLGCIGNRVYTGLGDDEAYIAIPGSTLQQVISKLRILVEANDHLESFHRSRLPVRSP